LEPVSGIVSLRSAHGLWLVGEFHEDKTSSVYLHKTRGEWTYWRMEMLASGKVSLRSAHQRYLGVEDNGTLLNDSEKVGKWETWGLRNVGEAQFGFQSTHGKWLCGEPTGVAIANRDWAREWEVWHVFLSDIPLYDDHQMLYI